MNNLEFNTILSKSFSEFLRSGSRSNKKLKILHGAIAGDLQHRLGGDFSCIALGVGDGKEKKICGRYFEKTVDIAITKGGDCVVAGIGVKFVMQNYAQNSNNYFESMLGETANVRSKQIPYFQILIVPSHAPYYDTRGRLRKWENLSEHQMEKYRVLSEDNPCDFLHTPQKTLLYIIDLPTPDPEPKTRREYCNTLSKNKLSKIEVCDGFSGRFSISVIFNDYEKFAQKVVYSVLSI